MFELGQVVWGFSSAASAAGKTCLGAGAWPVFSRCGLSSEAPLDIYTYCFGIDSVPHPYRVITHNQARNPPY